MNAKDYNRINRFQVRDGIQLINKINITYNQFEDRKIACILDIGCGPGNLTVLLNKMSVKHIIGVDIDEKMIEFAQKNNTANNIQYLTQDLGLEWTDLRTELKEIEGKVSLIFTNHCLHWIYIKKDNVIENMYRLLDKSGRIYSLITCIPNPLDRISSKISYFFAKFSGIPLKETQEKEWTESFERKGLKIIYYKFINNKFLYENNEFDKYVAPIGIPIYQQFYGYYLLKILQIVANIFGLKPSNYLPKFKDESTGQMMCEINYQSFIYIMCKK